MLELQQILRASGQFKLQEAAFREAPYSYWGLPVPCLYAVTSDPTFSPITTRRTFPG